MFSPAYHAVYSRARGECWKGCHCHTGAQVKKTRSFHDLILALMRTNCLVSNLRTMPWS